MLLFELKSEMPMSLLAIWFSKIWLCEPSMLIPLSQKLKSFRATRVSDPTRMPFAVRVLSVTDMFEL